MIAIEDKRKIYEAGKSKQESILADFRVRINDIKSDTIQNENYESASQTESRRDGEIELLDNLNAQLDFAEQEYEILKSMSIEKTHSEIEFGSVVITNHQKLFVSVSLEEFEVDGEIYFGISTKAPLYSVIKGKKAGDSIILNGISHRILEVY